MRRGARPPAGPDPASTAALTFRCRSLGITEEATQVLLHALEDRGVRHIDRYTRDWSDAHLRATADEVADLAADRRDRAVIRLVARTRGTPT